MSKVKCVNCTKLTKVNLPNYRCEYCNYPLSKEPETTLTNEDLSDNQYVPNDSEKVIPLNLNSQKTIISNASDKRTPSNSSPKIIKKILNKNPNKTGKVVAGWLIIHTENIEPLSYDLFVGENFFGTEAEGYKVDIPIKNDIYVSRSHANIQITKDFLHRFHYELIDDGTGRKQGPSLNGTYINGNQKRIQKETKVFLKDGDTIQVGETKLVFKTVSQSISMKEAAQKVLVSDYTKTIILG